MKIKSVAFTILLIPAVVLVNMLVPGKATAAFNQSNLMDDLVFNDSSAMNASQIDDFLNSFPSSCISTNNGFSAPNVVGYNPSQGFLYGANVSAGTVIYNAAQAYDLNPRVILTTLQKEQALVTGSIGCHYEAAPIEDPCSNPPYGKSGPCAIACQYAGGCVYIAMGYDCPQRCVLSSTGFSKQIIRAAWKLKFTQQRSLGNYNWNIQKPGWDNSDDPQTSYTGYMTEGFLKRSASSPPANYDGYRPINGGAITVHMDTGATVSLYAYTPFLSGGQSFYNIFTNWFGLPYAFDTLTPHPNGTLVSDGVRVFMIEDATRRHVTYASFLSHNWRWSDVKPASTGDKNLSEGTAYTRLAPGTVFTQGDGSVYIVDIFGGVLKKQWLSSAAFTALGYNWSEIMRIGPGEAPTATEPGLYTRNRHPAGSLIVADGKVYQMQESSRRHVLNPVVFDSYRFRWDRVRTPTADDLATPVGPALETKQGSMFLSSGSIFVIDYDSNGSFKRPVGPWECYSNRLHYTGSDWYNVPSSYLPNRTGSLFTC